jgi:hypothetical protein
MQDENALRVTGGGPHEVLNRIDFHRSTLTTTRPFSFQTPMRGLL